MKKFISLSLSLSNILEDIREGNGSNQASISQGGARL